MTPERRDLDVFDMASINASLSLVAMSFITYLKLTVLTVDHTQLNRKAYFAGLNPNQDSAYYQMIRILFDTHFFTNDITFNITWMSC